MKLQTVAGDPIERDVDLLVICLPMGTATRSFKAIDRALGNLLSELQSETIFRGKLNETLSALTWGDIAATRVAVVGLGPEDRFDLADLRHAGATSARLARRYGCTSVAVVLPDVKASDLDRAVQLTAEGVVLGTYQFTKYRTRKRHSDTLKRAEIVVPAKAKVPAAVIKRAKAVAAATCAARDLVNEPAGFLTPVQLASHARELARTHKLDIKVLTPKECSKLGMGMFLGVGQGSDNEPRFIHLTYRPKKKARKRIALIGKGVTFDSGGYSLKPSLAMLDMKIDMSGAAAVLSSMSAIAQLGCPYEVHAIVAAAENMVSGKAYRLGDVLESMSGLTVEINNTDAEGRLTMGDALYYARKTVKADEIIDFATLTGACVVALGPDIAGVMSRTEPLVEAFLTAAGQAGEDVWRLPLPRRLNEQLKSNIADLRNTGERYGGALTAGLFLEHFVGDTPWVHVDIAGPAAASKTFGATLRGGTGFGVASIVELLTRQ